MSEPNFDSVYSYFSQLQKSIRSKLESIEINKKFLIDKWEHNSVIGESNILEHGTIFEKAGIGLSFLEGSELPKSATLARPELSGQSFRVCGISMIIHPENPYVPTMHANLRLFISLGTKNTIWWFGGGFDLTPYYPFKEDCVHWHTIAYKACHDFDPKLYYKYKKWADEYFFLKHRQEARGIGGLFFDDVNHWDFDKCFAFIQSVGNNIMPAYLPIVNKRKNNTYAKREKDFQLYRRGRYVEYNLLQDRGTLFGLQSNGRTESILMSMPPKVAWNYCWQPMANSPEEKLKEFLVPQDWLTTDVTEEKCI